MIFVTFAPVDIENKPFHLSTTCPACSWPRLPHRI